MFTSVQRATVEDLFFLLIKKFFFEMTKSFEFELMSLFEISFIVDMLVKLEKLGQEIYAVKF